MFKQAWRQKSLIVFDLDGTLTPSKSPMQPATAALMRKLLGQKRVAIISGGRFEQFKRQFMRHMKAPASLMKNLFLFPTTSTSFYRYRRGWKKVYAHNLSGAQKKKIMHAFERAFADTGYRHPKKMYGPVFEDRGTQITFSALGQDIVNTLGMRGVAAKAAWNKKNVRPNIVAAMKKYIPGFEVKMGGLTSIDVTAKGITKAYGLRQIMKELNYSKNDILFVGDDLRPGGNDYPAKETGVVCVSVTGPKQTEELISFLVEGRKK